MIAMNDDRIAGLDSVGFDWKSRKQSFSPGAPSADRRDDSSDSEEDVTIEELKRRGERGGDGSDSEDDSDSEEDVTIEELRRRKEEGNELRANSSAASIGAGKMASVDSANADHGAKSRPKQTIMGSTSCDEDNAVAVSVDELPELPPDLQFLFPSIEIMSSHYVAPSSSESTAEHADDKIKDGDAVAVDELPESPPLLPPIDIKSLSHVAPSSSLSTDKHTHDKRKDVIMAKGAAAQTMTNPGNLYFYQLCDDRYDEFSLLVGWDPKRREIAEEIVDAIIESGGVFRTRSGGVMTRVAAIDKARDRLRQISKPKIRPSGFGPNDVVAVQGAAFHLYPGNAKWHELLDRYVLTYFRDYKKGNGYRSHQPRNAKGKFRKGKGYNYNRPPHQYEIVDETIRIIHDLGGKFLDGRLNELSHQEAAQKTHNRFKDLKKHLIAGTRSFVHYDGVPVKNEGLQFDNRLFAGARDPAESEDNNDMQACGNTCLSGADMFRKRLGGFTSVKAVVSSEQELRTLRRRRMRERSMKRKKKPKLTSQQSGKNSGSVKDDSSFDSAMLDSDGSLDNSDDEDSFVGDGGHDMTPTCVNKQTQDDDRATRLERRRSGIVKHQQPADEKQAKPKRRMRSRERGQDRPSSPEPAHPLSEYELKRLDKIKRNQAKLKELGLL